MVLPAKIFEIKEEVNLGLVAGKLRDFREEEVYQTERKEILNLVAEILDLKFEKNVVSGVFSRDFVHRSRYRRKLVEDLVTEEAPFWIKRFGDRAFLIVMAPSGATGVKKLLTGYLANKLSEVLFIKRGAIVEVRISNETLRELHESNPQATKLVWFDDVDIPGVEKLCLAGSDLADTEFYHDYTEHGKIWYVVFEVRKQGIVVGISRKSVVTLFSKSTRDEFINYISEEFLKLIE